MDEPTFLAGPRFAAVFFATGTGFVDFLANGVDFFVAVVVFLFTVVPFLAGLAMDLEAAGLDETG